MKVNQKNKTRIGISLLCAIILLTGCHITPNKKQDGEKKKYPKLVVVYSDAYGEDSSFSQVQEEINKITRKKLGVEVEFHLISDSNYSDAVELMLTSGEQVDILWGSNSLFVKAYVNRQLCDLEPLLKENGKDIIDAVGWKYINCCRIGGTLYGLPNNRDFAAGWDSYALRKDILNKYNIKASDIKNIKDLEKVFDLVLEKEKADWCFSVKEGGSYSGTGDLLASVLSAGMVRGIPMKACVEKAVEFLGGAIHDAVEEGTDRNDGVCFEKYLGILTQI